MGIVIYILSLFILYLVIASAVKTGINSSRLIELLENQQKEEGIKHDNSKPTFLDKDLDD